MKIIFKFTLLLGLIVPFISIGQQNDLVHQENSNIIIIDSTVKTFFDAKGQILVGRDTTHAIYYQIIEYKDGRFWGPVRGFYINRDPYMTGYYLDNNISQGYENGKFKQILNYNYGLLDGVSLEFYPSGAKKIFSTYEKGNKYGCQVSWDIKGVITYQTFIENKKLIPDEVGCNTIDIGSQIAAEKKAVFDGLNYINYPDSEITVVDKICHYLGNSAEIIEVILPKHITPVSDPLDFSPSFKIDGFKRINGQYSYTYGMASLFEDGKVFEGQYDIDSTSKDEQFYFRFQYKKPSLQRGMSSLSLTVFFLIKDRYSEAVIRGYFIDTYLHK